MIADKNKEAIAQTRQLLEGIGVLRPPVAPKDMNADEGFYERLEQRLDNRREVQAASEANTHAVRRISAMLQDAGLVEFERKADNADLSDALMRIARSDFPSRTTR